MQEYVPGYHLKNAPVFDVRETPWGQKPVITILLEVEVAGDYLPKEITLRIVSMTRQVRAVYHIL